MISRKDTPAGLLVGYIASVFASRVLEIASADVENSRAWRSTLKKNLTVNPEQLGKSDQPISDALFFDLLETVAEICDFGRSIGLRVGSTMRCDDYGAFGLAFKSSVDLGGAIQRVSRYGKVVTNVANFTVTRGARTTWMTVPAARSNRLGEIMTSEIAIAAATALSREVGDGAFEPTRVSFIHNAPESVSFAEEFFRCPVRYARDRNGIEIHNDDLRVTNSLGDAEISKFFDRHLDAKIAERRNTNSLDDQVIRLIEPALSEGPPRIEAIARRLGMSSRTLQRRLADQHCAYAELVERARRGLATDLLREGRYGLAEIAFLCGYSDQSTFSRAFRRWEGKTPASFRRASLNS